MFDDDYYTGQLQASTTAHCHKQLSSCSENLLSVTVLPGFTRESRLQAMTTTATFSLSLCLYAGGLLPLHLSLFSSLAKEDWKEKLCLPKPSPRTRRARRACPLRTHTVSSACGSQICGLSHKAHQWKKTKKTQTSLWFKLSPLAPQLCHSGGHQRKSSWKSPPWGGAGTNHSRPAGSCVPSGTRVPGKTSLKTRFIPGGKRPSLPPTPAALAGGLTAGPLGTPRFPFKNRHTATAAGGHQTARGNGPSGSAACPRPPASAAAAIATLQTTARWVTVQTSPALC